MTTENLTININTHVKKELEFLFESLSEYKNNIIQFENLEHMINFILCSVADGSRRPGAWERQLLEMMGIVPDNPIFHEYRNSYGKPENKECENLSLKKDLT